MVHMATRPMTKDISVPMLVTLSLSGGGETLYFLTDSGRLLAYR